MFMSVLFFSLWSSNGPPGGLSRRTSGPPTALSGSFPSTPVSPPDTLEVLRLRQENASLIASKSTLDGRLQQLQVGLDEKEQERLRRIDEIKKLIVEKAKLEEQMKGLQSDLLRAQQAAAGSNAGGMGGRALSTTSTASPPSSPTNDMVPKTQLEVSQALTQRLQELLRTAEEERNQFGVKIKELEDQLALPDVEKQKKEWHEKIENLRRLMLALENIKPPLVPEIKGFAAIANSRRGSIVSSPEAADALNSSFNASFSRMRRASLVQGHRRISRTFVKSPSPEQELISGGGSPKDQSLISFPFPHEDPFEMSPQWVDLEQWRQAYRELKRYLEKIKSSESSDDEFVNSETAAAASSAQQQVMPETLAVGQLKQKLRERETASSQLEVKLDAAQKEIRRLTAERNALLQITGLSGDDLTHGASGVTIGKRLPSVVALSNLCALLKKEHKRVAKQCANGTWDVQKISDWCCV